MLIDINVPCGEQDFTWDVENITDEVIGDIERKILGAVEYAYDEGPQVYPAIYMGQVTMHLRKLRDEYPEVFKKISLWRISKLAQEEILEDLKRGLED